jgi:T5SS/PEP-CTERM-associated repeat protein
MNKLLPMTAAALLILGGSAAADDYYWNNSEDGNFDDPANWNDGTGGVPGSNDVAIFDTESVHAIYFWADHVTDRLLLRSGELSFDGFGEGTPHTYSLLNTHPGTPALVIGRGDLGGRDVVRLSVHQMCLDAASATIGQWPDATGRLFLSGSNSSLSTMQQFIIGQEGFGALEAQGGAGITSGSANIGLAASGVGEVTLLDWDTQWTCEGPLTVGMSGEGSLTIDDDAAASCHDAIIAQHEDSTGTVSLGPHGAEWIIDGTLDVGMTGSGTLEVLFGSIVNHTFAIIGTYESWPEGNGGVGEVILYDSPWTIDGDLYIGFFGIGTLLVESDDSIVDVTGDVSIGLANNGTLILSRGGTMTIGGNLAESSASVTIEIGDDGDYPAPAIEAGGTMDGLEPEVILRGNYDPDVGDTFAIAHADGGLGAFSFILPELPEGMGWEVIQDEHDVSLTIIAVVEGDVNGDGVVDTADLLQLLGAWGACEGCPEDINGDGLVDTADLLILLGNWRP